MELLRSYGLLLHPSSLPGPWGIGTLGEEAKAFLRWAHEAGASWWQVLPLGPTGYGDSPYQSFSAFAGNPYLIDLGGMRAQGWLEKDPPQRAAGAVDYGWLYQTRWPLLRKAYQGFKARAKPEEREDLAAFERQEQSWLDDFALFMALKERWGGLSWDRWPQEFRLRAPEALRAARQELAEEIAFQSWLQWRFERAWQELRTLAQTLGLGIIGDMPIFVAYDSADVWAHPEYFLLDPEGRPLEVAGVPPDYFSATGQLWGNPLYRWERMREDGFSWWIARLRSALRRYDLVRIDHFRGFEACWAVPFGAATAEQGRWLKVPGDELFQTALAALGSLPIVAEDLGVITPEVEALRDRLGFPGIKVLQFAFSGEADNLYLPRNYPPDLKAIVYTGTHDNETSEGWFQSLSPEEQARVLRLLEEEGIAVNQGIAWSLIELAFQSSARLAIIPLQDVLGLGHQGRMNVPGRLGGNWSWRLEALPERELALRLSSLAVRYQRRAILGA